MDITQPLRLAVGSHQAGSGKGCAMNLISWETGDTTITDLPQCADPMLARIVQRVNDQHCSHREGDLLCPPCSLEVLTLAHRTVGTSAHGLSDLDLRRVWVRVAVRLAREVLHSAGSAEPAARAAIEAAEKWAADPTANAYAAAYAAATNAAYAAAYAAATNAAANAAYAAANAYAANAAYAAANAAYAASAAYAAANANDRSEFRMSMAHHAVDEFQRLTGLTDQPKRPEETTDAYAAMCRV